MLRTASNYNLIVTLLQQYYRIKIINNKNKLKTNSINNNLQYTIYLCIKSNNDTKIQIIENYKVKLLNKLKSTNYKRKRKSKNIEATNHT